MTKKKQTNEIKHFYDYDGILFIGDPHAWSKSPGKRLDEAIFPQVVLHKLEQSIDIAIKNNLYVVILGDLFHVDNENNISLLTKMIRIFKKLRDPLVSVEGNHEKKELKLTDDVALSMLKEADVLNVMEYNNLYGCVHLTNGKKVYLGGTPYGMIIPNKVNLPKEEDDKDTPIIWTSHHDLDFGDTYPGVIPVPEIHGAFMLVNGHIHKTKPPVKVGGTKAHNPGNITRLSTDCKDHVPAVWMWKPELKDELEPIALNYEKHIFNLVGKQIEVVAPKQVVAQELETTVTSKFVEKMKERAAKNDFRKTDDGVFIKETIKALGESMGTASDFIEELLEITDEAITTDNNQDN